MLPIAASIGNIVGEVKLKKLKVHENGPPPLRSAKYGGEVDIKPLFTFIYVYIYLLYIYLQSQLNVT